MREFPRRWWVALLIFVLGCVRPHDSAPPLEQIAALDEDVDFGTGDVSPDGRYISEIDWDTGDLQLIDLETGEAEAVTGQGYAQGGFAWMSAFSGDGERIAVAWYVDAADRHELRVVNRDGTGLRTLVPVRDSIRYIDPLDWSPDGTAILVGLGGEDRIWRLGFVAVADGSIRVLKTFSWLAPGGEQTYPKAYVSPDGRYVAYDYRSDVEAYPRDVYALDVESGEETALTSGPPTDRLLGWSSDGAGILLYSDRDGSPGIWELPVRDGRPAGDQKRIRAAPPGLVPLGLTSSGYLFGRAAETMQIHTGAIDPVAGRVLRTPEPVADPAARMSLAGDWSPDGTRLAYNAFDPLPAGTESLVIRDTAGELIRQVVLPAALHVSTGTLRWMARDQIVLFGSVRGRFGVQKLDLTDGSFTTLPVSGEGLEGGNLKWVELDPLGRSMYLFRLTGSGALRPLVGISAATGEAVVIGRYDADIRSVAVSPDGGELAIITRDRDDGSTRLRVLPAAADAGSGRVVAATSARPGFTTPVTWTPDGSRILYATHSPEGRVLWSVVADGSEEPLRIGGADWCCGGHDLRFHPEGRRMAVPAGTPRAEVWRLRRTLRTRVNQGS